MMSTPAIDVRDVCFDYGEQEVLHNVTFQIQSQSLVAIVGPNGGGKSTLLKLMLGALEPKFGQLRILNRRPAEARTRIGYVPQSIPFDAQFPVSVDEVIKMGCVGVAHWGFYGQREREAVRHALVRVQLEGFEKRAFSELSGGERQRVLIAQALVSGAELLLLDEPAANIDPERAEALYALFRDLAQKITVIMVSHNLSVVTAYATHVLCVNRSANLHTIAEVSAGTIATNSGSPLLQLYHDASCTITDPSIALHQPHHHSHHV